MAIASQAPSSCKAANAADTTPASEEVPDDHVLLSAFKRGDREAFATLYRCHSRAVFQFVFYMAGSEDTADDLTQEVFVWLIHHPDAFDPKRGDLPAFLGGVARRFWWRHQRAQSRWSPLEDTLHLLQRMNFLAAPAPQVDSVLDEAHLREAIARLPPKYREAIVLCDLQEHDYAETARILGCSIGTVRSRLHRGRGLLARKLNPTRKQGDSNAL